MIKAERQTLILDYINGRELSIVEDMVQELNVPFTTVRRDLLELEEQGLIIRVHGGAKPLRDKNVAEEMLDEKLVENIIAKKQIAAKALDCIKKGETIFLDAGSNTYYLSQIIKPELELRILTNSIINAQELTKNGNNYVHILGGRFKPKTGAIIGFEAVKSIQQYSFDLAFIGANAVDNEYNLYTTDDDEAQVKEQAIKQSRFAFALADRSKFNSKSFIKFASKKEVTVISED
ncbi:DeoR/GlpR family DNA-binding transcription regulator [Spiroplasma endosymbiont of Panorpa germanica]|uniref:DeoR/GlpR family DNA-binding transcription regulator n=1 Tax=Spiroplasma endosymbiont of Panorpa germanica TaxID=3066314 RepID=UPI0030CF274B